jgi:hypothetical protein
MTLTGLSLTNRSSTASNATTRLRESNLSWRSTAASAYFLSSEQIDHRLPSRMLVETLKGVVLRARLPAQQIQELPLGLAPDILQDPSTVPMLKQRAPFVADETIDPFKERDRLELVLGGGHEPVSIAYR